MSFCADTAQFVVAGSTPSTSCRATAERVTITRWKDATGAAPLDIPIDESIYDTQVQWFAAVGTGVVDWPAWMRLLRDMQYSGWAIFELDAAADPVADLRQIMAYVNQALLPIYR
jgi:sugar phosphate isomerase/epimerase